MVRPWKWEEPEPWLPTSNHGVNLAAISRRQSQELQRKTIPWWYHLSLVKLWPKLNLFLNFWVRWGNKFYFNPNQFGLDFHSLVIKKKIKPLQLSSKKMSHPSFPQTEKKFFLITCLWTFYCKTVVYCKIQSIWNLRLALEILKW